MGDRTEGVLRPLLALAVGIAVILAYIIVWKVTLGRIDPGPGHMRVTYFGLSVFPGSQGGGFFQSLFTRKAQSGIRGYFDLQAGREGYHANTHPPGTVTLIKLLKDDFSVQAAYFFLSLIGLPLIYYCGIKVADYKAGLLAAAFWIFSPLFLLFAHRTPDPFYGTLSALLLATYLYSENKPPWVQSLAGLSIILYAAFNFSVLPALGILGVDAIWKTIKRREAPKHFLCFCLPAGMAYLLLLLAHYNYLHAVKMASDWSRLATIERHAAINLTNVFAFLLSIGFPAAVGAIDELFAPGREGMKAGILFVLAILVFTLITPGEVERCWNWLAPFFLVWAGKWWAEKEWFLAIPMPLLSFFQAVFMANLFYFWT